MGIEDLLQGRVSGPPLKWLAAALRRPATAQLARRVLERDLGLDGLRAEVQGPLHLEPDIAPRRARSERTRPVDADGSAPVPPPWCRTADTLTGAYRKGSIDPSSLLERLYTQADELAARQPYLGCLWRRDAASVRRDAEASTRRWREGNPLGPLDGVPVVVKEQVAVAGLPHRMGGEHGLDAAPADATVVARLRRAGALIVGSTAMTELGLSPIGPNPKRPALRNPHHLERTAGGSSTGSGVAVATGLCPLAVAADGGGSIRIPATMVGVFGLKPSYGRVSRAGSRFSGSLDHLGPIGASTADLAAFLDVVCGPDPADPASLHAPPPGAPFTRALGRDVRGLRVGVPRGSWRDADPAVVEAGERALRALEAEGAERVEVDVPLARHAQPMGAFIFATELAAAVAYTFRHAPESFGPDVQVVLQAAGQARAADYLQLHGLREALRRQVAGALEQVDVLALPTTVSTALPVSDQEDRTGRLDAAGVRAMTRHTFLANLTGLPAGTAPVGLDGDGLPIGLQLVGDGWDEATVLGVMAHLERCGAAGSARAPHYIDLFG